MLRYLLGEMTENEQTALEQEYFNDRRLFEQLVQAENELVDGYARRLLPPPVRDRFKRHYLAHPGRRARARFAETLAAKLEQTGEAAAAPTVRAQSSWSRRLSSLRGPKLAWALSTALLLIASIAALFIFQTRRAQQSLLAAKAERSAQEQRQRESQQQAASEQRASEKQRAEADRSQAEQPSVTPVPTPSLKPAPPPALATLTLTIAGTRGASAGPSLLVIPARTEQVRLLLDLRESDYSRYSATLQRAGGEEIFTRSQLTPKTGKSGASLVLIIPAQRFIAGEYILSIKRISDEGEAEDISKSLFRVERR